MKRSILIVGGYGLIGSALARHLRKMNPDITLVLAGRHPEQGDGLARELGNAHTQYLDIDTLDPTVHPGAFDLIVSALQDPANILITTAMTHGIAHIDITKIASEVAPVAFAALHQPPRRPVVLLGHWQAGIATLVALNTTHEFRRLDSIDILAVYDPQDPIGPMTANDSEEFSGPALVRRNRKWVWVDNGENTRRIRLANGTEADAAPIPVLDVSSLAAVTDCPNIRFDFAMGTTIGFQATGTASHDITIDFQGELTTGETAGLRTVISDPKGQAHLTALGMALMAERILGLDSRPLPAGGLYLPETLTSADSITARLKTYGISITTTKI